MMDGVTKLVEEKINEVIRYNELGVSDEKTNNKFSDSDTVAMTLPRANGGTWKIKAHKGRFYNPLKVGQTKDYGLSKLDRKTGEEKFKFINVTERSYNLYINFLRTLNDSLLVSAERES